MIARHSTTSQKLNCLVFEQPLMFFILELLLRSVSAAAQELCVTSRILARSTENFLRSLFNCPCEPLNVFST